MDLLRVWAVWALPLIGNAYVVIHQYNPERNYSECWKPCLFAFCKPVCTETTTTTTMTSNIVATNQPTATSAQTREVHQAIYI